MKELDIKGIIANIAQCFRDFLGRTVLVILTIILIWIGFGIGIGYRYLIYPIEGNFPHEKKLAEINIESYLAVRELWVEKEERFGAVGEKVFNNPLFPAAINPAEPIDEKITVEELEDLLARTLFEFYQKRGEKMPPISERALIWEELKLGSVQEYQGTHSQNILLLKTLMKMLDNQH